MHTYVRLQPAVIQLSPVCDADSDDEWNMLGRRVTDKEQHLPNQDGPVKVHTVQAVSEHGPVCAYSTVLLVRSNTVVKWCVN